MGGAPMRRRIWGSVAVIVSVMAGAAYLPRATSVPAGGAGAQGRAADIRDRIAAASVVASRAIERGTRVRMARAAMAARHAALAGSARAARANAWLQRAALDLSIQGTVATRGVLRDPGRAGRAALVAGGLVLAAAVGGAWARLCWGSASDRVWARLCRGSASRRAVRRLARRGESCARIARHTRLAQDAVRSLTGAWARAHASLE